MKRKTRKPVFESSLCRFPLGIYQLGNPQLVNLSYHNQIEYGKEFGKDLGDLVIRCLIFWKSHPG